MRHIFVASILLALLAINVRVANAQSFSCPIGKEAACLDYGDKVCSSFAKCVESNASCFSSYTCDFKGFVCKSDLEEVVDKHDQLVDEYNDLIRRANALATELQQTGSDLEASESELRTMRQKQIDMEACLSNADTVEDAKRCTNYL